MPGVTTPWRVVRYAYLVLIALFLVGILVQAYLAGRIILGPDAGSTDETESTHASMGWMLAHGFAGLVLLVSFFTRAGWKFIVTSVVWGLMAGILPILAEAGLDDPDNPLGAFHPLLAVILAGLTLHLMWRAWGLANEKAAAAPAATTAPPPRQPGMVRP